MTTPICLQKVYLSADVFGICIHHALTTEKQEIMGLLIGEVDEKSCISKISACLILHRSDKQPDRVEISPEQLITASAYAEQLTANLKRPMRVLGWYHSHPHITVWPSHVDVKTQANYQLMDPLFVGLIFSVYASDSGSVNNKVQVTCFQATGNPSNLKRKEVELIIHTTGLHHYNLEGIKSLPNILIQEEIDSHKEEENDNCNILARLHNNAYRVLNLVHMVSTISTPMYESFETHLQTLEYRKKALKALKRVLINRLNK